MGRFFRFASTRVNESPASRFSIYTYTYIYIIYIWYNSIYLVYYIHNCTWYYVYTIRLHPAQKYCMPLYISETCPTVVYFSERHALYLLHFRRQCVLASHFLLPRKKCLFPPPSRPAPPDAVAPRCRTWCTRRSRFWRGPTCTRWRSWLMTSSAWPTASALSWSTRHCGVSPGPIALSLTWYIFVALLCAE